MKKINKMREVEKQQKVGSEKVKEVMTNKMNKVLAEAELEPTRKGSKYEADVLEIGDDFLDGEE